MHNHDHAPRLAEITNWWWSEEDSTAHFGWRLSITFACPAEFATQDLSVAEQQQYQATDLRGTVVLVRTVVGYHLAPELIDTLVKRVGEWFLTDPSAISHLRCRRVHRDLIRGIGSPTQPGLHALALLLHADDTFGTHRRAHQK
ncbi:hypothetical protein GH975_03035 [Litorivicinus lipolyticus]|uniref:Uncharacterized protein n=1 Tax=Litorivicinus lipolyticus TaxID=418701 RepID=A0A5Q2QC59_9GAMM|nr:hypothetical protein [Litorivicinus lipolyticus]QGG79596.1 hypothetical protein GH975_03035 [Litorivicinus lipolyticus]